MASMEATTWPASRQYEDRAVTWDKKFEQRRRDAYGGEEKKLTPVPPQTKILAFLEQQVPKLDLRDCANMALRAYLEDADEGVLSLDPLPAPDDTSLALLDDRSDNTGWTDAHKQRHSARNWQEYESSPPRGENEMILALDAGGLYRKLLENARQ